MKPEEELNRLADAIRFVYYFHEKGMDGADKSLLKQLAEYTKLSTNANIAIRADIAELLANCLQDLSVKGAGYFIKKGRPSEFSKHFEISGELALHTNQTMWLLKERELLKTESIMELTDKELEDIEAGHFPNSLRTLENIKSRCKSTELEAFYLEYGSTPPNHENKPVLLDVFKKIAQKFNTTYGEHGLSSKMSWRTVERIYYKYMNPRNK